MTWDKINFANKMAIVTGDIAKSGRGRSLPLGDDAINLIKERMKYQVSPYVFIAEQGNYVMIFHEGTQARCSEPILRISDFMIYVTLGQAGISNRNTANGTQRVRRMGNDRNGSEVCTPKCRPFIVIRESSQILVKHSPC